MTYRSAYQRINSLLKEAVRAHLDSRKLARDALVIARQNGCEAWLFEEVARRELQYLFGEVVS